MKATDTFHVPPFGHNCAQAVAYKWRALYDEANAAGRFAAYGGGRAPGGMCGALYAAVCAFPEKEAEIIDRFKQACGATCCRDLKGQKKTPCTACVDTADNILEDLLG